MTFFPLSLLMALVIFAIAAPAVVAVALTRSNHRRPEMNDEEEDNENCEEERLARTGEMRTGLYGPRWFCSENIVPIEQARTRRRANCDFHHRQARGGP